MSALIGFRPIKEIHSLLYKEAALAKLCGFPVNEVHGMASPSLTRFFPGDSKRRLKQIYIRLMQTPTRQTAEAARIHLQNLKQNKTAETAEDALFCLLAKRYGLEDPGIFCAYLLNYVKLKPGEALFLGPNTLHSYISGVILECMSPSDNVVRAGLTSKHCDIPTLLKMLHYKAGKPKILKPIPQKEAQTYPVPTADFSLSFYAASKAKTSFMLRDLNRPSIVLVLEQEGQAQLIFSLKAENKTIKTQPLTRGNIFFLPGGLKKRGIQVTLELSETKIYRAS